MRLLDRLEPTLGPEEEGYRLHFLSVDRAQAAGSVLIAIRVSLGEHLSSVRVDPGRVQQILLNLAVNARDAMPIGGTLAIQTRNTTLDEPTTMSHSIANAGQYVVLTVSDDGTGMDAATLAQIFEPFFTTKPKGRGRSTSRARLRWRAVRRRYSLPRTTKCSAR